MRVDPTKALRQVQQRQEQMMQELSNKTIEATVGGGAVRIVMTGQQEVKELVIAPEVVNPEDVEMLQDLILAAIHEATNKVEAELKDKIGALTGGMRIPGLF